MTPQDEKQAIYLAMTVTAETVTKGLTEIIDNVKIALEALLSPFYKQNDELRTQMAKGKFVDPMMVPDESARPFVNELQKIHHSLSETNREIAEIQSRLAVLQGKSPDEQLAKAYDAQLAELHRLNKQYENTYLAVQELAMTLPGMAQRLVASTSPEEKRAIEKSLEQSLGGLYEQSQKLKEDVKMKNKAVEKTENIVTPTPRR